MSELFVVPDLAASKERLIRTTAKSCPGVGERKRVSTKVCCPTTINNIQMRPGYFTGCHRIKFTVLCIDIHRIGVMTETVVTGEAADVSADIKTRPIERLGLDCHGSSARIRTGAKAQSRGAKNCVSEKKFGWFHVVGGNARNSGCCQEQKLRQRQIGFSRGYRQLMRVT